MDDKHNFANCLEKIKLKHSASKGFIYNKYNTSNKCKCKIKISTKINIKITTKKLHPCACH